MLNMAFDELFKHLTWAGSCVTQRCGCS